MHIYEYLFAAVIIMSMLLASSTMITTISEPTQNVSDKEQLKVAAQKLITQILLDSGYPSDWGSNITIKAPDLEIFGLAKHGETTREAYTLDPNKILRLGLNNTSQFFIHPSYVLNLLNLGNDYGLALEFYPPLNVTEYLIADNRYTVNVISGYEGLPIVNAIVNATMFYSTDGATIQSANAKVITNYDGTYTAEFAIPPTEMKIMVVVADYSSIRVTKVFKTGLNVTLASMLGEYLVDAPVEILNETETREIIVTKKKGTSGYSIDSIQSKMTIESQGIFKLTYLEPSTVAALALSKDGTSLILGSKDVTLTYSSIPGATSFPFAYSLERTVIIDGSTYTARLYLWRMSF